MVVDKQLGLIVFSGEYADIPSCEITNKKSSWGLLREVKESWLYPDEQ